MMALAAGGAVAIAAVAAVLFFVLGGGTPDARAALQDAGCALTVKAAVKADHSVTDPAGTSKKWNTDPPTSGPHNQDTVFWGTYNEPVNQAQLVHNLEHGGIAIQYGDGVSDATVEELKRFAQGKPLGTVLAPYPKLGDKVALEAWVTPQPTEPDKGDGYLAMCSSFEEKAFEAFFDTYQFKGPERFRSDSLLPGGP